MNADASRRWQRWIMASALVIFACLIGGLVWVGETSRRNETKRTALAYVQVSPLSLDETVKCLRNNEIKGLSLAVPKGGGWISETTFQLVNPVWHIEVHVRDLQGKTEIKAFSREGRIRADHKVTLDQCVFLR